MNNWTSVKDGLPEIEVEKTRNGKTIKKSVRVLCACKQKSGKLLVKEGYYEWFDWSEKPFWRIPGSIDSVTHWMPLPEPPLPALKFCPTCRGLTAVYDEYIQDGIRVRCTFCGHTTNYYNNKLDAAEDWNNQERKNKEKKNK